MAEYKLISPVAIHIKGLQPADIRGLHALLKQEGCIDSENPFSDREKAIALDESKTDSHNETTPTNKRQPICLSVSPKTNIYLLMLSSDKKM